MPQLSAIKPSDTILSEQAGFRRAMACTAFWSDHPLNVAFRSARQTETFSLKDFTAFVISMPPDQFLALVEAPMLAEIAAPINAAQRAWATRRAHAAARVEIAAIKAGVDKPSAAVNPDKPVVDLWLDDAKVGCGQRRFIVLECGSKWVKLFYPPQLVLVTVDRVTFDRHAKPAANAKVRKLARIIRDNVAGAKRVNEAAGRPVMPDGGARTKQALKVLR